MSSSAPRSQGRRSRRGLGLLPRATPALVAEEGGQLEAVGGEDDAGAVGVARHREQQPLVDHVGGGLGGHAVAGGSGVATAGAAGGGAVGVGVGAVTAVATAAAVCLLGGVIAAAGRVGWPAAKTTSNARSHP